VTTDLRKEACTWSSLKKTSKRELVAGNRKQKRSTGTCIRPVRYVVVSREWIKDAPPPQTAFQI